MGLLRQRLLGMILHCLDRRPKWGCSCNQQASWWLFNISAPVVGGVFLKPAIFQPARPWFNTICHLPTLLSWDPSPECFTTHRQQMRIQIPFQMRMTNNYHKPILFREPADSIYISGISTSHLELMETLGHNTKQNVDVCSSVGSSLFLFYNCFYFSPHSIIL